MPQPECCVQCDCIIEWCVVAGIQGIIAANKRKQTSLAPQEQEDAEAGCYSFGVRSSAHMATSCIETQWGKKTILCYGLGLVEAILRCE